MLLLVVLVRRLQTDLQTCWPRATSDWQANAAITNGLAVYPQAEPPFQAALADNRTRPMVIQLRAVSGWLWPQQAFLRAGAIIMIIWRPSSLGNCSTMMMISQVIAHTIEQIHTQFLVRNFTTTEAQRDLALVAISQKAADVAQFDVVVAIVGTRTELDFLDLDDRLLGLGFCSTSFALGT